jgi:hypothetical protein
VKTLLKTAAALVLGFTFQANAFADKGHGQNNNHGNHVSNTVHVNQVNNNGQNGQKGTTVQNTVNHNKIAIHDSIKTGPNNGGVMKKGNGPQGNQYKSYGKYEFCKTFKDYKGPCYKGKHCNFYTTWCWNESYGCNLYWCPTETCWFYWCQPHGCYLPIEYVPCGGYVFEQ